MKDKYDHAIEHLTENPGEIETAWNHHFDQLAGCLFQYLGEFDHGCGCPTQVKAGHDAATDELKQAVENDPRIPDCVEDITLASLHAFAEIQRLADRTIRNQTAA